jgi:hypothetical protein
VHESPPATLSIGAAAPTNRVTGVRLARGTGVDVVWDPVAGVDRYRVLSELVLVGAFASASDVFLAWPCAAQSRALAIAYYGSDENRERDRPTVASGYGPMTHSRRRGALPRLMDRTRGGLECGQQTRGPSPLPALAGGSGGSRPGGSAVRTQLLGAPARIQARTSWSCWELREEPGGMRLPEIPGPPSSLRRR